MKQASSQTKRSALRIALIYALVAMAWILLSDQMVAFLASATGDVINWQLYKGVLFVAITSVLLYGLLRYVSHPEAESAGALSSRGRASVFLPWTLFILMGSVVAVSGWRLFVEHRGTIQQEKQHDLAAIADLKVGQIGNWLAERRADAETLSHSPLLADAVESWLHLDAPAGAEQARIAERLKTMQAAYSYAGVALLDAAAHPRFISGNIPPLSFDEQSMALAAMSSGEVVVADFRRVEGSAEGKIELDLFAPLVSARTGLAVGAVYLRVDPEIFLFPLIQTWPFPSRSAESFLVEREGDHLLYLSELRFHHNTSMKFTMPMRPDLPAALALKGVDVTEGRDYRGKAVLAAMRAVPGSPWYMVAKIDREEVYAPINALAKLIATLVVVFIVVSGLVLGLWWRRRQSEYEAHAYRTRLESQALAKHFEFLSKYANDIILLSDGSGRIVECNDRAEQSYGYSRNELLSMAGLDLAAERCRSQFELQWGDEGWENGAVFETWQQRKGGKEFPVEVSARSIRIEGGVFRQCIIRDITERRAAQDKLTRVNNLYAALSETNHAITHATDEHALFQKVCAIAVEKGNFKFAWIGLPDPASGRVNIVAHAGDDQGYLATLRVSVDVALPEGRGPTGTAIREGRIYVANDYGTDFHTRPWQAALAERGIQSAASLPLYRRGEAIGAFTAYAQESAFFQTDVIKLLQEMAHDVSFALDNIANERKRQAAEVALRVSEERFRAIFDSVSDAIFIQDMASGAIVDVNQRMCQMFGYSHDEALQHDVEAFSAGVPPYTQTDSLRWMQKAMEGEPQTFEWRSRRKDGTLFWVEVSIRRANLSGMERMLVSVRDIEARKQAEAAQRASDIRFRELFDNMKSGAMILQMQDGAGDLVIQDVNPAVERIEQLQRDNIVGRRMADVFPGAETMGLPTLMRQVWKAGQPIYLAPAQYQDSRLSSWRELDIYRLSSGEVVALYDEVTDRMEALEKLRLDAKVFEESAEGISITDASGKIIAINRAYTEITGYGEEEVIGRNPSLLKSGRHDHDFYTNMWAVLTETGHWIGEIWDRRKNGEVFPSWQAISAVRDEQSELTHYISVLTDISSRKESEERIRHLSHYDALTDLPNQALLMDHIDLAIARAKRTDKFVAVLAINLERFRNANERFGHSFGDKVLQTIAQRLTGLLRDEDTVSRIGADNYVVLVPDIGDKQQASIVAAKILEAIAEPIGIGEVEISMNARIGIALYPTDGGGAGALLQNADVALARASGRGSDSYNYYNQEQSKELEELLAIEQDLRMGIPRNELRLHYQPRVDLISGEIVSMEALVRWQHPQQGLLFPTRFIHVAEQSGLILPLGKWVLWEACRQLKEWRDAGHVHLKVSVNVSAVQFHQSNLPLLVSETLAATGLPASSLELEVTESLLMQDADLTVDILRRIKETGIAFSIDDFGTGYSSLAYLKTFPIDTLKMDQSFIRDLIFDASDAAIVQGTIALAHSLKLKVVAEGVETEAQMNYLRTIHCDEMQGYFYSRPLPADAMLALIQGNKRLQDISKTPGMTRKLLLVDDEPNISAALNRLLRREGYTILIAKSAREALELLGMNNEIGVVISDQRMPVMTGTELMTQVKILYPGIIRIILSGYTDLASVTDAINKGEIYKFLTKPWDDDEMKKVIREAFLRFELVSRDGNNPSHDPGP
ncbi:MAG: EAL domain-containing protein [Sulfurimicrobium sp.]|jgi:diguanylate cyclase (GGDEF)-like protein/PAS domain S-box-containing protein|nr:EAL domain-containing protein [Sulfurimicrobium sp.]